MTGSSDPLGLRSSKLWVAPIIGVVVATAAAAAALVVDHLVAWEEPPLPLFAGDVDTVRTMLSVIATAVTTLLALVFTIIAVIIQLASSQYSPRALRTLLKDRPSQFTIGVFVGTISYALILLLALRIPTAEDQQTAAGLAPTLAFGFAVLSIATFAAYSNHISHAVRISSIVNRIAEETRQVMDRRYPDSFREDEGTDEPPPDRSAETSVLRADRSGVVVDLDDERLFALACEQGVSFRLVPKIGDYVPHGAPLFAVAGSEGCNDEACDLVALAEERAPERDTGWGLRLLVDIAVRALSPGVNDPTTAAQTLDRIGDLLGRLARRKFPDTVRKDANGEIRLVVPVPTWEELVALGLDEVRLHGAHHLQIAQRLRATLEFLLDVAPPSRRWPVEERLRLLEEAVAQNFDSDRDRDAASRPRGQPV